MAKNIKVGTTEISKITIGTTEISKVYVGNTLVWEKGGQYTNHWVWNSTPSRPSSAQSQTFGSVNFKYIGQKSAILDGHGIKLVRGSTTTNYKIQYGNVNGVYSDAFANGGWTFLISTRDIYFELPDEQLPTALFSYLRSNATKVS